MIERSERERLWAILDRIHDVTYFGREARDAYKALGEKDAWARYFLGRSAPLGSVTSAVVIATFYHFGPELIEPALQQRSSAASPEDFLAARLLGFRATMARLVPDFGEGLDEVNEVLAGPSGAGRCEGMPLYGANVALGLPSRSEEAFFMIATRYREHRGDCHNAVLVASHVSAPEAALLVAGLSGPAPERAEGNSKALFEKVRIGRGFHERDWQEALDSLRDRGLLGPDGAITEEGVAFRADIEERTDALDAYLYGDLSSEQVRRLVTLLAPTVACIDDSGEFPSFVPVPVRLVERLVK